MRAFRGKQAPRDGRPCACLVCVWAFFAGAVAPCAAIAAYGNTRLPPVRGLKRRPRNAPLGRLRCRGDRDGRPYRGIPFDRIAISR